VIFWPLIKKCVRAPIQLAEGSSTLAPTSSLALSRHTHSLCMSSEEAGGRGDAEAGKRGATHLLACIHVARREDLIPLDQRLIHEALSTKAPPTPTPSWCERGNPRSDPAAVSARGPSRSTPRARHRTPIPYPSPRLASPGGRRNLMHRDGRQSTRPERLRRASGDVMFASKANVVASAAFQAAGAKEALAGLPTTHARLDARPHACACRRVRSRRTR